MRWTRQSSGVSGDSRPRNYLYSPVIRNDREMTSAGDGCNYLNATYHTAPDGNVSDSSSAEDLVIGSDNGAMAFEDRGGSDSQLLLSFPKTRNRFTKYFSRILIALLVILCLVLAAFLLRVSPAHSSDMHCVSSGCVDAASYMRNAMNPVVDPCVDFYEYACGGWMRNNPIPDGKSAWGIASVIWKKNMVILRQSLETNASFIHRDSKDPSKTAHTVSPGDRDNAQQKSRTLYKSCMDDKRREKLSSKPLKDIIKDLGGFQDAKDVDVSPSTRVEYITNEIMHAHKRYSLSALFSTYAGADDHQSSKNIIKLYQSGLAMLPVYYKNTSKVYNAYRDYMVKMRVLLGDDFNKSKEQMKEILDFEVSLSSIFVAMENISEPAEAYNKMELNALQKTVTQINWLALYRYLYDGITAIDTEENVVLQSNSYFQQLDSVISKVPPHVIHNYVVWVAVRGFAPYITDEFSEALKPVVLALQGAYEKRKRWEFCTSYVDSAMGLALGAMFVEHAFPGTSKQEASKMVEDIRLAFERRLPNIEWMDQATKKAAADKANAITRKIGFPSMIMDQTKLDEEYKKIQPNATEFFQNHLAIIHHSLQKGLNKLRKPVDKTRWEMTAPTVNAYYNPTSNEIVFPAGILQPPFYRNDFPMSLNFGGIGAVIGHELLHAFDNTGRRYDKYGNSGKQWWTNSSISAFKKKTQCFIDEYSHLYIMGKAINGKMTLGENLADNGGLQAALEAYLYWVKGHEEELLLPSLNLSNIQVFFTAFAQSWCYNVERLKALYWLNADVHSPNKDRVLGVVSNMPQFSEAFHCSAGKPMNGNKKCSIW